MKQIKLIQKSFNHGLLLFLLLISVFTVKAQQLTQNFTYTAAEVQIYEEGVYDIVKLSGCGLLQEENNIGQPQLPVKNFRLLLPKNAEAIDVSITVNSEQLLQGNYYIFPTQPPQIESDTTQAPFVEPDTLIYNSNNPFPTNNIISYQTIGLRDYNILALSFVPFRYIPLNKQLYLFTEVTITIEYTVNEQTQIFCYRTYGNTDAMVYKTVKNSVLNSSQINTFYPEVYSKIENYQNSEGSETTENSAFLPSALPCLSGSAVDYVIITNNTDMNGNYVGDFTTMFQELADWKTQTGTPAVVITIDQIEENYSGVDTQEKIREFIKDARQKWGTDYILLGGETRIVPVRTIYSSPIIHYTGPSDLYYSDIWHPSHGYNNYDWNLNNNHKFGESADSCDFFADIAVGRVPVYTTEELELFLQKNYTHYRCSLADYIPEYGSHLGRHLNIATITHKRSWGSYLMGVYTIYHIAKDFRNIPDLMYTLEEYIPEIEWDSTWSWEGGNLYDYLDDSITVESATRELNKNNSIIFHSGHATLNRLNFGAYNFTINQLKELNETYNGILTTSGCFTCPVDYQDHFGKRWLTEQTGGVAFIGSVRPTISLTKISWYTFFNQLYTNNNYKLGYTKTLNYCDSLNTKWNRYVNATYHLFGDPELPIYTHTPDNIVISYPSTMQTGGTQITISVSYIPENENATICLYKENEIYQHYHNLSNGITGISANPDTEGEIKMTITGHNINPKEYIINVIPNTGKHLFISNYTIIDQDGDGYIEAGETVQLSIELTNSGLANASNIEATLSTYNNFITILQNYSTFNNINAGQSANSFINFEFIADNNINTDKIFDLVFDISANNAYEHSDRIKLNISTTDLKQADKKAYVNNIQVTDFFAGDNVNLFMQFQNISATIPNNFIGTLNSNSEHVTITNNTQNFEALPPDIYKNNYPFNIEILPTYAGQNLYFTISLTDNFGNTKNYNNFILNDNIPEITELKFNAGQTNIDLRWQELMEDYKGFNIYRSHTENGIYTKINKEPSESAYFSDIDLTTKNIYYYKISVVSRTGDELPLNMLTAYKTWTSLPYADNFPLLIPIELSWKLTGSPTLFNVDEDPYLEIFQSCEFSNWEGGILAFNHDGTELFDYQQDAMSYFSGETSNKSLSSPCIADIDNDNSPDVIAKASNILGYKTFDTDIDENEMPDLLWQEEKTIATEFWYSSPEFVLSDLNANDSTDIIVPFKIKSVGKDSIMVAISVYQQDSLSYKQRWLDTIVDTLRVNRSYINNFSVADLDGNGKKEIIVTAYKKNKWNRIYIFQENGDPYYSEKYFEMPLSSDQKINEPIVADIDKDGIYEIVLTYTKSGKSYLCIFQTENEWNFDTYELDVPDLKYYTVGDINNDNNFEIIATRYEERNIYIIDNTGNIMEIIETDYKIYNSPMLADIDTDDDIEIIVVEERYLNAYNPDGTRVEYWQQDLGFILEGHGQPAIGDIYNDGKNEVVMASGTNGLIHVWETDGDADKIECGLFRYDEKNTGVYPFHDCMFSGEESIIIDQPEPVVWNTDKEIRGNITIESGSKLTITSKVSFAIDSKIIVEAGAELIIDGGTLTTICSDTWQGITVLGNSDLEQYPTSNQGYLEIKNGAIIENAERAVFVGNPEIGNNNENGGIVKIDGAFFCNNVIAVQIPIYQNFAFGNPEIPVNNVSSIKNTIFETTDELAQIGKTPNKFIWLWSVDRVTIYNNDFINSNPESYDVSDRGWGIYSSSTNYFSISNTFQNLDYGIYSQGIGSISAFKIDNCSFTRTYKSIYLTGTTNATIIRNNIDFSNFTGNTSIGISVYHSNDFTIEENNIIGRGTGSDDKGIALYHNSQTNNSVYLNEFSNITHGTMSEDSPNLFFECNEFSGNNNFGIYIKEDGAYWSQGDALNNYFAGNKFLETSNDFDISSTHDFITYVETNLNTDRPTLVNNIGLQIASGKPCNECLSHINGGGGGISILLAIDEQIQEKQTMLDEMVDGGDTESTVSEVENANSQEALLLRNSLLAKSPNLSDTVMVTTVVEEGVLPEIMLTEVLSANSQSAKSKNVNNALDERQNQLPVYMRDEINLGKNSISPKEELEIEIQALRHKRGRIFNNKVRYFMQDILQSSKDSLLFLLENENNVSGSYRLLSYHLSQKDHANAELVFNSIPLDFELTAKQESEYNKMTIVTEIQFDLLENEKTYFEIDSLQKQVLYALTEDTLSQAGAYARSIISLVDGVEYD